MSLATKKQLTFLFKIFHRKHNGLEISAIHIVYCIVIVATLQHKKHLIYSHKKGSFDMFHKALTELKGPLFC